MEKIINQISLVRDYEPSWNHVSKDLINAFGSIFRMMILSGLRKSFESLVPYFLNTFGEVNTLLFKREIIVAIQSGEGGGQGDPLMPLFFAVGYHELLLHLEERVVVGITRAFLDDTNLTGPTDVLISALEFFISEGMKYGLELQPLKTQILIGEKATQEEAEIAMQKYLHVLGIYHCPGMHLHPNNQAGLNTETYGIEVLGSPLGHPAFVSAWLDKYYTELEQEADRIMQYPDSQGQHLFLYYCFQPKVNHLMRTIPPNQILPFLHRFDLLKRSILNAILHVQLTDDQWLQATLPVKSGGFGLTNSVLYCEAAYLAACHSSYESVRAVYIHIASSEEGFDETPWAKTFHALNSKLGIEFRPEASQSKGLQRMFSKPLQITFAEEYHRRMAEDLLVTAYDKARLLSVQGPHAGAFLHAVPKTRNSLSMTSREF